MLKKRKDNLIQVGLWQHQGNMQAVWFDRQNQPKVLETEAESNPLQIAKQITAAQANMAQKISFRFITAVPPQQIWSKTLILPHLLNSAECEQQCHYVLQQELPVPLNELWFDFCSKPLKQGFRLDIFAIKQQIAKTQVEIFSPLKINVLDNLAHSLMRAFQYFRPTQDFNHSLLLYQDEQISLAIQNKAHQLQILQTQGNLTALFAQFCQRYGETPEQLLYYRQSQQEALPADWVEIHSPFPFIALGCALWQQDLTYEQPNH